MRKSAAELVGLALLEMDRISKLPLQPEAESPIERMFEWDLGKYLNPEIQILRQVPSIGFRVDYAVQTHSGLVGMECDGKDFHEKERDRQRDLKIIKTGRWKAIYRFPGKHIYYRPNVILRLFCIMEPSIFSDRGRVGLQTETRFDDINEHRFRFFYAGDALVGFYDREDNHGKMITEEVILERTSAARLIEQHEKGILPY